ncbi:nucleotidyltransferase family protein [Paramagnetospirillum kuznetsovii]|uniref:Nucleotidyltransferase family protein n=1 Tax=Paramagnetospirillum kuznetsovii TaxID=2053833 RepID=A0A364NZ06_9PROT|nr:nucleotidyltransferase family protein [Paramagnetospirillum kuznetsovii]RAU22318.1 nucleotidyltransferase family protein [Paramagnetospirillum kuznetsovii]
MTKIAGLVLAAGAASRMGRDKRLLPVGGVPMVLLAIQAAQGAGLDPVMVVTGPDALDGLPPTVQVIRNPDPGRGMASSLVLGVESLPADAQAVVVLLADMPLVTAGHVAALAAAFDPRGIVVPICAGRRGNPVLLGRSFFPEIVGLTGDKGARGLMARHADAVVELDMDRAVLVDVDTPEDLRILEAGA